MYTNLCLANKINKLIDRAEVCICPDCRDKDDFTVFPFSDFVVWAKKAAQGVDGFYLQTL